MTFRLGITGLLALTVLACFAAGGNKAYAACAGPAGTAGDVVYNDTAKTFQYCNDTNWVAMNKPGAGSGGCAAPVLAEGHVVYNSNSRQVQGCAGNVHRGFGPAGGKNGWKHVSTSKRTCAIKEDNTLWCWGENGNGQVGDGTRLDRRIPVAIAGTWQMVSTVETSTCGIKLDGTLWCWGSNYYGQLGDGTSGAGTDRLAPTAVSGGGTWKYVAVSSNHSCGIKTDDTLWCWGSNGFSELGNGGTGASNIPVTVSGGGTWKQVTVGSNHSCGIKTDDTLWCWGANGNGRTGRNLTAGTTTVPTGVNGGGSWKQVSTDYSNNCAIKSDDTLWCWGGNMYGQNGDNSTTDRLIPTAVSGGGTWKQVSAGTFTICGLKANDTVWCWGSNSSGKIGDGTYTQRLVPTASVGGTWAEISSKGGNSQVCGIKADGTLHCWGQNTYFGNNSSNLQLDPVAIADTSVWKQVTAAGYHTCGIKADDTLWCWGYNNASQLGDGGTTRQSMPVAVSGGGTWKQVVGGEYHTCGIKTDDTLWCWGSNANGRTGRNTTVGATTTPAGVTGGGTWKQVALGSNHTCGIKSDDTIWCWGYNGYSALGDGTNTQRLIPTAVSGGGTWKYVSTGYVHTCGIKMDDTLWCWGANWNGELGDNSGADQAAPVAVSGGGTWKQVSLGGWGEHSCAIKSDDTIYCWGGNWSGHLGDGTTNDSTVPVAASGGALWKQLSLGDSYSCAVKQDDTLHCWGEGDYIGDGTSISKSVPTPTSGGGTWTQVSSGDYHGCAISAKNGRMWCWGDNWSGQNTNTEFSYGYTLSSAQPWCGSPEGRPGTLVYNSAENKMQYCDGAGWVQIGANGSNVDILTGLVGYWALDESTGATIAADGSGTANSGTLTNMDVNTDWVAGHLNNALDFDGLNDVVVVADHNSLDLTSAVTVSAWIKGNAWANTEANFILAKNNRDGAERRNYYFGVDTTGRLLLEFQDGASNGSILSVGTLSTGQWYHVAATYDQQQLKLYINGVLNNTVAETDPLVPNTNTLSIGRVMRDNDTDYGEWDGQIDEVRLYNRALTAAEIQALAAQ